MTQEVYKVAHIHEQGQDMIIIPVSHSFNSKNQTQQTEFYNSLQYFARSAGLAGSVCLVWQINNRFHFLAPRQWNRFFESINMNFVMHNINKQLTCRL